MSSTKIIIGVIAVAVLGVGGYFALQSPSSGEQAIQNGEQTQQTSQTQSADGKKMAFSEFIKRGGSYQCTVNQNVGGTDTTGTTFIHDGMIRGEYTTSVQGMTINSTLIVRDGYTYSWTSMAPTMGFKAKVVANTSSNTGAGTSGSYSFNAEQIGDYNCEAWTADSSRFVVPTNITFRDVAGA